jgi:hypothetical protein
MSDGPPAGHGTTTLTGFVGHACAAAKVQSDASDNNVMQRATATAVRFMTFS